MIVLLPLFGDVERFRPLLDRWFAGVDRADLDRRAATFLTDKASEWAIVRASCDYGCSVSALDVSGFSDLVRPGQPFDLKGALVCAALRALPEDLLILDADAFLVRSPIAELRNFANCPVAMPIDGGAVSFSRSPTLEAPFAGVRKYCAGVQFFGGGLNRSRLVAGYRRAWQELAALPRPPWTPPLEHLREQHAWSIALHRRGGRALPNSFNWAPQFYGPNPEAVVEHWFGRAKWAEFRPASA